jgi:4-carboxymuconolactone decarboxylase
MTCAAKRSFLFVSAIAVITAVTSTAQSQARPGDKPPVRLKAARLAPVADAQMTEAQRQVAAKYGRTDNGSRTLLNLPQAVDGATPMTVYLTNDSTLAPRHRAILILRTAWLTQNDPLWGEYSAQAAKWGLTAQEIHRIAEGSLAQAWPPSERVLLRLADELYRNSSVTDQTWKELSGAHDVLYQVDAVETVDHFVFLSLLYNAFGVQPDAAAAHLPADVPYRVSVPEREPPLRAARIDPVPGTEIAVTRTLARHPKLNQARAPRANFVNRVSPLSPRHREMLILRTGWDCQSEYEWAQHVGRVGRAREHGLDPVKIAAGPAAAGWDPFESTILTAADELYRDTGISDATWKALAVKYDTASLVAAVFTASSYRATSMALNAFGVQLEPGDERFPRVTPR